MVQTARFSLHDETPCSRSVCGDSADPDLALALAPDGLPRSDAGGAASAEGNGAATAAADTACAARAAANGFNTGADPADAIQRRCQQGGWGIDVFNIYYPN